MSCVGIYGTDTCRIFDPDHQPSVARDLEKGWSPIVWMIINGNEYVAQGLRVPLSSQVFACKMHEDLLIADGGWDGTGDRQG